MLTTNRQILLILVSLAIAAGQSIVFSVLPPLGREVGLSELHITGLISASALIFTLCSPKWGRLSDKLGRRPMMLVGIGGYTLGSLLFAIVFELGMHGWLLGPVLYIGIVLTRLVQSAVMSATPGAILAYVSDNTPVESRAKIMARVSTGNNLGTIIGPVVVGVVTIFGLTVPLYFSTAFAALAFFAVLLVIEPSSHTKVKPLVATERLSWFDPRIRSYLAVGVGFFVCFAMIQQTLAFSLQDQFQLSGERTAQLTGAALVCLAGSSIFAQSVILQLMRFKPDTAIIIGLLSTVLGYAVLLIAQNFVLYAVSMLFLGFGLGMAMPNVSAAAANAVCNEHQGAVAGFTSAIPATGFAIGPIIGGGLYQIQPDLPKISGALLALSLLALFFLRVLKKP